MALPEFHTNFYGKLKHHFKKKIVIETCFVRKKELQIQLLTQIKCL